MRRRTFLIIAAGSPFVADCRAAAQERRVYRIAWLVPAAPSNQRGEAFKTALLEHGWRHERDFTLEWQPTHGRADFVEQAAASWTAAATAMEQSRPDALLLLDCVDVPFESIAHFTVRNRIPSFAPYSSAPRTVGLLFGYGADPLVTTRQAAGYVGWSGGRSWRGWRL